jgi:hypothetical protein
LFYVEAFQTSSSVHTNPRHKALFEQHVRDSLEKLEDNGELKPKEKESEIAFDESKQNSILGSLDLGNKHIECI